MFILVWIASIVGACIVASRKKLNIALYLLLAIFLGPIALIIVLAVSAGETSNEIPNSITSLQDVQRELTSIKNSFVTLQKRIANFENKISDYLNIKSKQKPQSIDPPIHDAQEKQATLAELTKNKASGKKVVSHEYEEVASLLNKADKKDKESFEFTFGKYWLNRIGVGLFFLGVAFFISYTFKYLSPVLKILMGYLFSAAFFTWGNFLERKKNYTRISWGILGLAWGLVYLSTYAMHYIEATQIIINPLTEVWFLMMISFAAVIYNLKYKSWVVTSITYLFAFITAGLGGIEYSTVIYCTFLTGSIAYLSYKLNWYKFLLFGICGVYTTYIFWLSPQIFNTFLVTSKFTVPIYQFHLSFGILLVSWALFASALFLLKIDSRERIKYVVAGILVNVSFFVFLGLSELYRIKPHLMINWDIRFWFLILLSCFYFSSAYFFKFLNKRKLIVTGISIASSLLTMAVIIRFPSLSVGFFWILEVIALFAIGVYYKEFAYRALAYLLSALVLIRLFFVDYFSNKFYMILGVDMQHNILIFLFAAICFYLLGAAIKKKEMRGCLREEEGSFLSAFVISATFLFTIILGKEMTGKWLSLAWALEGVAVLGIGFLIRDKVFRLCALCVLLLACLKLIFIDLSNVNTIYKILTFTLLGAILVGASLIYSKFMVKEKKYES